MSQKRENRPLLIRGETVERVLKLIDGRVHDAIKTDLPDTPSADDLGLAEAIGSVLTTIATTGAGTATTTAYALFRFVLAPWYDAGDNITLRVRAKTSAIAEVSDQLDVEAKLVGEDGSVGSDLVSTTIKQLTAAYADYNFTIAGATLAPGDEVQVRVMLARNDTGGSASGTVTASKVSVLHSAPDIDAL
jgi:hypothetical protein